jgi:hypothetical protein
MRRLVTLLAVSAVAVLVFVGALSMNQLGTAPAAAKESLTLIEHVTNETVVNLVGTTNGSCIRTSVGEQLWECTFTNSMEHGSLVVEGSFHDSGRGSFAITGGTGEYSSATGQMGLTAAEDSTADTPKLKFVFEIN